MDGWMGRKPFVTSHWEETNNRYFVEESTMITTGTVMQTKNMESNTVDPCV